MSRRIDIELTSALADNSWTWRAAGAKQPKGVLDGTILSDGAGVGDVIKVEVDQEIDGITVLSVVGGREKQERDDVLDLLPTGREFKPVIETRAKRDRNERGAGGRDGERRPRRDRDDRGGRGREGNQRDRDDRGGRGETGRGEERGAGRGRDASRRRGPSFTPPPEIPQRPKPKRLKPGKSNRTAVLADLPEEQRGIAELAVQGMGAVRTRLREENQKAAAEGRAAMPEATVLKMAEDVLPKMRVAEWLDRAEAAKRQMEHLDLRDLRSVVAAAGDPMIARGESTTGLVAELTAALATKQERELLLWFGDVDAALAVGRVIRALRLSSQPPKAGVPFPTDIAQRLVDSTNAALAPMDSPERWSATLEAAAFSPIRTQVMPARQPDTVNDELLATVKRLAPALPQIAAMFEVEVDPKASMPKPLRPGPRNRKAGDDRGKRPPRGQKSGQKSDGQKKSDGQRGRADGSPETERPPDVEPNVTSGDAAPEPSDTDATRAHDGAPSVTADTAPSLPSDASGSADASETATETTGASTADGAPSGTPETAPATADDPSQPDVTPTDAPATTSNDAPVVDDQPVPVESPAADGSAVAATSNETSNVEPEGGTDGSPSDPAAASADTDDTAKNVSDDDVPPNI